MLDDKVFLSYAKEDKNSAQRLFQSIRSAGVDIWFDQENLPPGVRWKEHILHVIRNSRYFIALLSSNSVSKRGFVQTEIKEGLEILALHPEDEVYIIPVRIEPCEPAHSSLHDLNWIDMFPNWENGESKLIRFLAGSQVRYDGIYVCEPSTSGEGIWRMARFFPNGKLIWEFSDGNPEESLRQLVENRSFFNTSRFYISGNTIKFTVEANNGKVDYSGEVLPNSLLLRFHSHINNGRGIFEYKFRRYPVKGFSSQQG